MNRSSRVIAAAAVLGLGVSLTTFAVVAPAAADVSPTAPVVINEVYGGGGNSGATHRNDFIELYNASGVDRSLVGWTVQYKSATGTTWSTTPLTGTIAAGATYLVAEASGGSVGTVLANPAVTGSINLSGTDGNVALVESATALTCNGAACAAEDSVIDLVGFGTGNSFAGAAGAPAPSNTTSVTRDAAHTNTADNVADFFPMPPTPGANISTAAPTVRTIAQIQGAAATSPDSGKQVTTSGVVTGAYADSGLNGYFIQTAGSGGGTLTGRTTSDGLWVYSPATQDDVTVGDTVTATGYVVENNGLTQLNVTAAGSLVIGAPGTVPAPVAAATWPATDAGREVVEAMLVAPQGTYTVSNTFTTNQSGEVGLAFGTSPLMQPTDVADAGSPQALAVTNDNAARGVVLDDGALYDYLADPVIDPPYFTPADPIRVGAAATFNAPVIVDVRSSRWKFQPQGWVDGTTAPTARATFSNTRVGNTAPDLVVGADQVAIASFNVLNYFTTLGTDGPNCTSFDDREGNPITVSGGCPQRGAWDAASLARQQSKIVAAINALDADVVGLLEIENSAVVADDPLEADAALATLVDALNDAAGPGTWAYVPSSGELPSVASDQMDVISNAIIYRPANVTASGDAHALGDQSAAGEAFETAREPIAQAFTPVGGGEPFLVVVNHFKSKSSGTGPNADFGDGQGASNYDRVRQADALLAWVPTVQQTEAVDDVFLVGDFNSYTFEDPLQRMYAQGYTDVNLAIGGNAEQSYSFSGLNGSLDHIIANAGALARVTDSDIWTINAPESIAFEYSRWNDHPSQYVDATSPFRSSDHDPVLAAVDTADAPLPPATTDITFLGINDFHGRIDTNTDFFAGTIEQEKVLAGGDDHTVFLSAGDNIGASVYDSAIAQDQPTIDVLNALGLDASAVGNHEFDKGFADLRDRVIAGGTNAEWAYLGANVYQAGTQTPALPEYEIVTVQGVDIGIIGAVTSETSTLVSPAGIAGLEFGDPVDAINRVADQLTDGNGVNGEADLIVAALHEGAAEGLVEGATFEEEVADSAVFAKIVNETSPKVAAIFTGHTHKLYAWDGPVPGDPTATRPIIQTGNYGEHIAKVVLHLDPATNEVLAYEASNVDRTTQAVGALKALYPAVAAVDTIVTNALAVGNTVGSQPIGQQTADITTAYAGGTYTGPGGTYVGGTRDDRSKESTLGDFVADVLLDTLDDPLYGGAEIGVVNPGGLRAELLFSPDGVITKREANNVLPFVNNLHTITLTGTQLKTMLEQQWQRNPDGTVAQRPYLQLGLSSNVTYTFDSTLAEGSRITSITINGAPYDPSANYRIGTFSFLTAGGDNFHVFKEGTNDQDTGLVDRDAWFAYLDANDTPGVAPDFARQAVEVTPLPTTVTIGEPLAFTVKGLDLTSLGSPANTSVEVTVGGVSAGTETVTNGTAVIDLAVPAGAPTGAQLLTVVAAPSGTTVTVPVDVDDGSNPPTPSEQPAIAPVVPTRLFDTRPGQPDGVVPVAKGKIGGDARILRVKVTDLPGLVPATGVSAVALNVTVTEPEAPGYLTVYACGVRQEVSSLNYGTGQTVPNSVIAPVSAAGEICFYSQNATHVLADVSGWLPVGGGFTAVDISRVFDTRPGLSPNAVRPVEKVRIGGDRILRVKVTDLPGLVPGGGVGAVSLNVTATNSEAAGFVTVYPCGPRPVVSSLNIDAGLTVANAVITPVSATGEVCFFASQQTDLLADVNGWFTPEAFGAVGPLRVFDTRPGSSPDALITPSKVKLAGGQTLAVKMTDLAGGAVPADGVALVSLNVTVTNPEAPGFLTVSPCGPRNTVSNVNYVTGQTVANAVVVPVAADGTVCFSASQTLDVIADVNGWFPAAAS